MTDAVTAATTTAQTNTATTAAATATISSDFETFLMLMTTQLENQDPLNPMDSAEYSTQLATFASVEQQALTNEYLVDLGNTLASLMGATGLSAYSDWIGKEALATGPAYFDGTTPRTLEFALPAGTEAANLVALDVEGNIVTRQALALGSESALWAGMDADGTLLPAGLYSFGIELMDGDTVSETVPLEVYNTVEEVQIVDGQTLVVMQGGALAFTDAITGIRAPR